MQMMGWGRSEVGQAAPRQLPGSFQADSMQLPRQGKSDGGNVMVARGGGGGARMSMAGGSGERPPDELRPLSTDDTAMLFAELAGLATQP
jgi:hypothetical protein